MRNTKGLTPFTKENAAFYGRKGALKSLEVRRRKKEMKEQAQIILHLPFFTGRKIRRLEEMKSLEDCKGKNFEVQTEILIKIAEKAAKQGDKGSAEFMRDTSGQKPKEEISMENIPVPKFTGEDRLED